MSRRQRSHTDGSAPQWGASVTLRALQSPTVPITPSPTHRPVLPKQHSRNGSTADLLSSSRSAASSERRPSSTISGSSPNTLPATNTPPSGSSGRNSNISDLSSTSGSAANATVAKAELVKNVTTPRKMSLSQLAYQQHSPAVRTSALGVYDGSPSVSPTMPVFPHGVSVAPDSQSPKRGSTGSTSPALLRGMALPMMYDHSQQQRQPASPTRPSHDFGRRSTVTNARMAEDTLETPRPSIIPEGDGLKNVAQQAHTLMEARRPAPLSTPPPPVSLRALRNKSSSNLSFGASNAGSAAPSSGAASSASSQSNTNSIARDSISSGRPAFLEEYNLDWDPDNSGYGNGGWDAETDDEDDKRQAHRRGGRAGKNVTMSDKVSFSRPPRSPTSPKAGLFRKAFRSANPKRDRSSSSATARRSSIKPIAPVPSPRSILRQRGATVGATSSPGRMSPFTSPSRLDPATYLASRSPARTVAATLPPQHEEDKAEEVVFDVRSNEHRQNPLPTPPKQLAAPKRRPSVPDSVSESMYSMTTPYMASTDIPFGSPFSQATPQMVDDQSLSPSSSMLSTPYFARDLGLDAGSPAAKNNASLHAAPLVRCGSDGESAVSQYDQEGSWDGHSVRDSTMSVVTPAAAAAAFSIALKNKRSVTLAEKSPLLAQKIVEMDESLSMSRHAVDGDDSKADETSADFEDARQQARESALLDAVSPAGAPTRIRIVRTEGDRTTGYDETLDSIHVFPNQSSATASKQLPPPPAKTTFLKKPLLFTSLLSPPKTHAELAVEKAEAEAEHENVEVNRFMSDHAARVKRIRSSGLFEMDATREHTWPTRAEWRDQQTGKVNTPGLVVAGALSCLAYLSPVHFRDMQRAPIPDKRSPSRPVSEFTMDSLKTSGERLFMSAFPMYERAFARLRRLWRWESKLVSLFWCACYFAAWYFSCLLPSAVTLVVLCVARNRRGIHARRQRIAAQAHRALVVNQLHVDDWQKTVKQAEYGADNDVDSATAAAKALRRYGHAAAMLAARLADAHERLSNTAVWARTPATMRTLIVLILLAVASFCVTPAMLVSLPGFAFGVAFWFVAPLLERKSRFVSWLTLDPVEFMLAGVPNDAQNAIIILRRNQEAGLEVPAVVKQSVETTPTSEERETEQVAIPSRTTSAAPTVKTTATSLGAAQGFTHDARWRSNVISFAASYQGLKGMLTLTTERLSFRAAAATSKGPSLDISLERITGLNKVSSSDGGGASANDGLQLDVRVSNNAVRKYSLFEMNMRDQAFNRILALAPHQWTQERPTV